MINFLCMSHVKTIIILLCIIMFEFDLAEAICIRHRVKFKSICICDYLNTFFKYLSFLKQILLNTFIKFLKFKIRFRCFSESTQKCYWLINLNLEEYVFVFDLVKSLCNCIWILSSVFDYLADSFGNVLEMFSHPPLLCIAGFYYR